MNKFEDKDFKDFQGILGEIMETVEGSVKQNEAKEDTYNEVAKLLAKVNVLFDSLKNTGLATYIATRASREREPRITLSYEEKHKLLGHTYEKCPKCEELIKKNKRYPMKKHLKTKRCSKLYTLKLGGVIAKTTKGELHGNLILIDSVLSRKTKEKERELAELDLEIERLSNITLNE